MQQYRWYHLLVAFLALVLYIYTPAQAEKSDLSTTKSIGGDNYTGTIMESGNVRIDRDLNEQRIEARKSIKIETDTDLPGFDYKNFWYTGESEECQEACANDPLCRAYTYVKPSRQQNQARCFLKSRVPELIRNPCCISGIKGDAIFREKAQIKRNHEAGVSVKSAGEVQTRPSLEKRVPIQPTGEMQDRQPDISGEWFSNHGDHYILDQRGAAFNLVNLNKKQTMIGRIEGESIHAVPESGGEEIIGHIFGIGHDGRAGILEWSNGFILAREPFQNGRAEVWRDEPQERTKNFNHSLENRLESDWISISGPWSSTIGRIYKIEQDGPHFIWRVEGLDELGEGRIERRHLSAKWNSHSGLQTVEGEAVEVTPEGHAVRIIWSNGVEFFRAIEQAIKAGNPREGQMEGIEKTAPLSQLKPIVAQRINPQLAGKFQMLNQQKIILNQWIKTGGPIGGLGYDVRFSSNDTNGKNIVYVTDNYSGVNVSLDGGNFYVASNDGISARTGDSSDAIPVFSLTVDPNNSQIIWAGLKDVSGCYKSTDGGKNWRDVSPEKLGRFIFRGFAVMPENSNIVFAAGEVQMNNPGKGFDRVKGRIYRSLNGGEKWKLVWEGDDLTRYVLINPKNPKIIYASCGIFDREAHNSDCRKPLSNDPNSPDFYQHRGGVGVLKSEDGGESWQYLNRSNNLTDLYVGSLVMHPNNPDILLAGAGNISASPYYIGGKRHLTGGVFLTTDSGKSWTKTLGDKIITSVEFSPSNPSIAYAAGRHSFYVSRNGGRSWKKISGFQYPWGPPGVVSGWPIDILVDPDHPGTLFVNNYGGGNVKSVDWGKTWALSSQGYTGALMFDAEIHPNNPDIIYVGARSGLFRSLDGGKSWEGLSYPQAVFAESYSVALHPENPNIVLASQEIEGRLYRSVDGGKNWKMVIRLPKQQSIGGWQYGFKRIAFANSNPQIVYAASCQKSNLLVKRKTGLGVFKSVDGGINWHSGQPANSPLSGVSVNDLAVHPKNHKIVYAATAMDGIYKTTDSGKSWARLTKLKFKDVRCVALDPNSPNTVYAGIQGGIVYVTRNGGSTWNPMASGMEPNASVWAIVVDPGDSHVVWAGSRHQGVYRWDFIEQQWIRFNKGLSTRAIVDLAISRDGRVLYGTTTGEGVFRLKLTK